MNLRARKSTLRRDLREGRSSTNAFIKLSLYIVIVMALSFGVFGSTVYFDGQSQRMSKEISINENEIYKLDREIQNLKLSLEVKSKREYIYGKIAQNNMGLRPANPEQIVRIIPSDYNFKNESTKGKKIAYSAKNPKVANVVND